MVQHFEYWEFPNRIKISFLVQLIDIYKGGWTVNLSTDFDTPKGVNYKKYGLLYSKQ